MFAPDVGKNNEHKDSLIKSFFKGNELDKYYNDSRSFLDKIGVTDKYSPIKKYQFEMLKNQQNKYNWMKNNKPHYVR